MASIEDKGRSPKMILGIYAVNCRKKLIYKENIISGRLYPAYSDTISKYS